MKKLITMLAMALSIYGVAVAQDDLEATSAQAMDATSSYSVPTTSYALHEYRAIYSTINIANSYENSNSNDMFQVGFKMDIAPKTMVDISLGFDYYSGYDEDEDDESIDSQSDLGFTLGAGASYEAIQGMNASLNVLGKLELEFDRHENQYPDFDNDGDFDKVVEESYYQLNKNILLLAQPEYYFSPSFSIFTQAGLKMSFVGITQDLVYDAEDEEYQWDENKNSYFTISTVAGFIGARFYF